MSRSPIRLNIPGIQKALATGTVKSMANAAAQQVASQVRSGVSKYPNAEVVVEDYIAKGGRFAGANRPISAVILKHPVALGIEAKYGHLIRAAASLGVPVRRRT